MALGRTSFLDAVNRVLQMLGEAPVNSLQGQFGLAKQAEDTLNDVSRTIQTEGWSFNTDLEKTLEKAQGLKSLSVGHCVPQSLQFCLGALYRDVFVPGSCQVALQLPVSDRVPKRP